MISRLDAGTTLAMLVRELQTLSPLSMNAPLAERYTKEQQDPIMGHAYGRVRFEQQGDGWQLKSSLPIELFLPGKNNPSRINWDELSSSETQGHALYKYSLGYLPTLAIENGGLEATARILSSAWEWISTEKWAERSSWMTSLDHCIAMRLRALAMLRVIFELNDSEVPEEVFKLIAFDAMYLVEHRSRMFPRNNHGAMVAIAAIHVAKVFPELEKVLSEDPTSAVTLEKFAERELTAILDEIFDETGIANENSPEYQQYWISLLSPLTSLNELFGASNLSKSQPQGGSISIEDRVAKARHALSWFIGDNRRMIPIGDSHPRFVKTELRDGSMVSEESGFAIYRGDGMYFTFNSGSSNYAHKHCDDLSITLQSNGVDVFLDAGYYGHDWNDPKVIYTKSQNAHSSLIFDGLDDLHPGRLYFPGKQRVRAQMESIGQAGFMVRGKVWIDDEMALERTVKRCSPRSLQIHDKAYDLGSKFGDAWKRFILPVGSRIMFDGHRIVIEVEEQRVELVSDVEEISRFARVTTASRTPSLKGWISPERNELVPATCLELPCSVGSVSTLRVVLS